MTIATLGAFVISAYEEAVGVMFFYRVGEYFEHRAVEKSRGQIMDAVDMRPETVNLLVGEEVRVKITDIDFDKKRVSLSIRALLDDNQADDED